MERGREAKILSKTRYIREKLSYILLQKFFVSFMIQKMNNFYFPLNKIMRLQKNHENGDFQKRKGMTYLFSFFFFFFFFFIVKTEQLFYSLRQLGPKNCHKDDSLLFSVYFLCVVVINPSSAMSNLTKEYYLVIVKIDFFQLNRKINKKNAKEK